MGHYQQQKKLIAFLIFDSIIIAALIIYFGIIGSYFKPSIRIDGILIMRPKDIAGFHLTDNQKKPFTKKDLLGHWTLMFFGFTHCEMVCPTTLAKLNKMYRILQKEPSNKPLPQIIFVSVDPARDTIDKINQFVKSFNIHFIGARGEMAEIIALEKQVSVSVPAVNSIVNHGTEVVLFNPSAQVRAYFPYTEQPEKIAKDYNLISSS